MSAKRRTADSESRGRDASAVMTFGDLQTLCEQEEISEKKHMRFADDEIADEGNDKPRIEDAHFVRCDFDNVGLKRAVFLGGSLTKCRFIDTYMRRSRFDGVDLTGTRFVRCNLKYASFDRCDLRYVEFRECRVDYENILKNLPKEVKNQHWKEKPQTTWKKIQTT